MAAVDVMGRRADASLSGALGNVGKALWMVVLGSLFRSGLVPPLEVVLEKRLYLTVAVHLRVSLDNCRDSTPAVAVPAVHHPYSPPCT